jgi:glucuronokinase
MDRFAQLASEAREAANIGETAKLSRLMDENFDLRRSIMPIHPAHLRMIETARSAGASAKFAGSGGAIIGVCPDDDVYAELKRRLEAIGCQVLRPTVR